MLILILEDDLVFKTEKKSYSNIGILDTLISKAVKPIYCHNHHVLLSLCILLTVKLSL